MKTRKEILAEIDSLQDWFAANSRARDPKGWEDRSKLQDELVEKLEALDD